MGKPAESAKEAAAAARLEAFMQEYLKLHPEELGVHYSDLFEQYLPVIARKAASLAGTKQPDIKPLLKKVTGDKNEEES